MSSQEDLETLSGQQSNADQWCFSYYAGKEHAGFNEKAALLKDTKWQPGESISISFLDGDPAVHEKVMQAARGWVQPGMANLKFSFRTDTNDTDIRISFRYRGSWSVLGTTCRNITDRTRPTMNFGWLNRNSTDDEINRVVLHEFGHAIGLIHEHMNPEAGIQWNRTQVSKDLSGPPNNWDAATIENNMFKTFDKNELELTNLDAQSIMMYPIPISWTTNNFSCGLNARLSDTDIKFIRRAYPGNEAI